MDRLPQLAFIIDPNREDIAVKECRKLGIRIGDSLLLLFG